MLCISSMAAQAYARNLLALLMASLLLVSTSSALEFRVGGQRGWRKPVGNESESYNHWAMRNRFHIGDSVHFKYSENDSVLVVERKQYSYCNTTEPLVEFKGGNTTFRFDRHGFFYFISGAPGHCKAGERLIIRVMVHPEFLAPGPAPASPDGGGSDSGSGSSPGSSSGSLKLSVGSFGAMAAALGVALAVFIVV